MHIRGTGCGKMMFMASEETFGSQRSLRGAPPSEKLHSLPKYTQNQDINTLRGNAARLPELTPALYHNFINCSWSLWYSERCTNCEESKHISAKCARKTGSFWIYPVVLYPPLYIELMQPPEKYHWYQTKISYFLFLICSGKSPVLQNIWKWCISQV